MMILDDIEKILNMVEDTMQPPHDIWDKLQKIYNQVEEMEGSNLLKEISKLQSENARLKKALERYANHNNWCYGIPPNKDVYVHTNDGWEEAEQALREEANGSL